MLKNKTVGRGFCLGFLLAAVFLGLAGEKAALSGSPQPLVLNLEDPPFRLRRNIEASFAKNVAYGPYKDNVLDIFMPKSDEPTPLIIFIHGGGFTSGDKRVAYTGGRRAEIQQFLSRKVAYATINYRLLDDVDRDGVKKPLGDSRRCLQFLRHHHKQLNVDPSRVAVYGVSAGAGTSLWLAFSKDMADPNASDPVLRESTRVLAAAALATQASYDLLKWETAVFASLGLTLEDFNQLPGSSDEGTLSFYGSTSFEELGTEEMKAYRASVDMLALMSPDDPVFYAQNDNQNAGIPASKGELFHHPLHAQALKDQAGKIGLNCVVNIPALNVADPSGDSVADFLLDKLGTSTKRTRVPLRSRRRGV